MQEPYQKTNIYFIPGQGADKRLFGKIKLDERFIVNHITYETPTKNSTMRSYAEELAQQIDQSKPFILIGASLGGMLATEITSFLEPMRTILISSAKQRSELPFRYRFQKQLPFYKLVPASLVKLGAKILQPLVESDRNKEKTIFKAMLNAKDPKFLSRTVHMIVNWERQTAEDSIIHIHGNKDHTLPIKNVQYDYLIEGGSHMMSLTRAEEINQLILAVLTQHKSHKDTFIK
ncbi:MAG: pimeloyl-ACP methyl ester carboxylesterase [Crocinitomix sp.]